MKQLFTFVLAAALAGTSSVAFAQWMWKDDAGHTVISDQPPPKTIPLSHILKSPDPHAMPAPASASPSDADPPKSLAEKDQEYNKRQKDAADAAKKQAEADAKAKQQASNCAAARSNLASLQGGNRIVRYNDKGEREFISDDQRQADIVKAQANLTSCN